MHLKNDNEMTSNTNHLSTTGRATVSTITTTATTIPIQPPSSATSSSLSSASSTSSESGVIIIDNKPIIHHSIGQCNNNNHNSNKNNFNNVNHISFRNIKRKNKNNDKINDDDDDDDDDKDNDNDDDCNKDNSKIHDPTITTNNMNEELNNNKNNNYNQKSDNSTAKNGIKININTENIMNPRITNTIDSEIKQQSAEYQQQHQQRQKDNDRSTSKRSSPAISIRSTSISIISIDENADDSSVIASDSDCEADAEGIHSNYVIKKLGQQTTYSPNSSELSKINNGLQVVRQNVCLNGSSPNPVPSTNSISLAENILNSASTSLAIDTTARPQIGSVALSNCTDVRFSDSYYCPVTIQQFMIANRDKLKSEDSGQDNPAFTTDDNTKRFTEDGDDTSKANFPPTQQHQPYKFIFNRRAVIITGTIIILTILIGILFIVASTLVKPPLPKNPDDANEIEDDGRLHIMSRADWGARPPKDEMTKLKTPVHRVIISHTATDTCFTKKVCIDRVQIIQNFHMDTQNWSDIGYNFLIGTDGRVYVGRSWDNMGAHTKGYNSDSLGISFIGTFTLSEPQNKQLNAAKLLIEEGIRQQKLVPDYRVYGHRQLGATESPGEALYKIIQKWPHWSAKI